MGGTGRGCRRTAWSHAFPRGSTVLKANFARCVSSTRPSCSPRSGRGWWPQLPRSLQRFTGRRFHHKPASAATSPSTPRLQVWTWGSRLAATCGGHNEDRDWARHRFAAQPLQPHVLGLQRTISNTGARRQIPCWRLGSPLFFRWRRRRRQHHLRRPTPKRGFAAKFLTAQPSSSTFSRRRSHASTHGRQCERF